MSKVVRELVLNQIKTRGYFECDFNFLGHRIKKNTPECTELEKLANTAGIKSRGYQAPSKTLFKACDIKYSTLDESHSLYKFCEEKAFDDYGNCKDSSLLICATNEADIADACPWAVSGTVGEPCECTI